MMAGLLRPMLSEINMVNAPIVARERGIAVDETRQTQRGAYGTYIRLTVETERQERSVAGTVFSDGRPRIIQIKGIDLEGGFAPSMLYITNQDKPGFIGRLGTLLGSQNVNIATFNLGRSAPGADAISLIEVDGPVSEIVIDKVTALEGVVQAKRLTF
jgi:D-3-phosphoglycerate dehydrogenase